MSLARRYGWGLAPLLIAASVVWLNPRLPDVLSVALWHLGAAALLVLGVARVSRLGRPLLTVLWAVMLVRVGAPAANYAGYALRQQGLDLGPVGVGQLLTLIQFVVVVVVVWLAWRQGASGRRYSMLVCAGWLVPGFTAGTGGSLNPDPGTAVLVLAAAALALHLASLASVAVAFGRFEELVAGRQRRIVYLLLALPLAAAVLRGLMFVLQLAAEKPGEPPLSFVPNSLLPLALYAGTAGVLLGLTWLATLRRVLRRRSAHTGAYSG